MAPWWLWHGLDSSQQECSGLQQCQTKSLLRLQIALNGIEAHKIKRIWWWQRRWPRRIAVKYLHSLLGQWAHLLAAGLPLLACVKLVPMGHAPMRLQYELVQIQQALLAGVSFSQALEQSGLFKPAIVHLVAAGEASGELPALLAKTHEQQTNHEQLKRRFKRSLFMPLVTLISGLLVSLLIVLWVVPQVASLYASAQYQLPVMTQWLMQAASGLQKHSLALLVWPLAVCLGTAWLWSVSSMRLTMELWLWRLPGIGRLMYLHGQAELFLILSLTFNAGVPLLNSLALAANASSWRRISRALTAACTQLEQGQKLSQVWQHMAGLAQTQAQTLQLMRMGEASGDLGLSLDQLQSYYQQQVMSHSQWLEQLLEPILLLLVSTFVGGILIALYLPLFQMGQMM